MRILSGFPAGYLCTNEFPYYRLYYKLLCQTVDGNFASAQKAAVEFGLIAEEWLGLEIALDLTPAIKSFNIFIFPPS
ncbi:hypothetical protein [Arsenophonus endosymbiont of Aleurodicus floccissimus]|uniref:hypothetical protein n=1 Tax=Arsenophonus endosymbiont of Aleurodicus floccissimus TaxID=2152761 RepID=UPI000E6B2A7B|nr:hypothetical protein [Arsenophonus endosymbiont of Aleurodicus floccissimus]